MAGTAHRAPESEGLPDVRRAAWPISAAIALASTAHAQDPARLALTLDCTDFTKRTDEAALVRRFGRENVTAAKLDGAEGESVRGTVIFPKNPARRLEVYWHDERRHRGPASIAIRGKSEWTIRVPGKSQATIGLKASLRELEEANGRAFPINGFGWDYGGFGAGWKGGALDRTTGGCAIGVRFEPDAKAGEAALGKVSGDRQLGSSDPALRAVTPSLSEITLGWPE